MIDVDRVPGIAAWLGACWSAAIEEGLAAAKAALGISTNSPLERDPVDYR